MFPISSTCRHAIAGLAVALVLAGAVPDTRAQMADPVHPMDALTYDEVNRTVALLREAGLADDGTRFPVITLKEMPKAEVLAWEPGEPFTRTAFVVMREDGETSEAVVDLTGGRIVSHEARPGAQPAIMQEEWDRARQATKEDPRWQEAMRRHGIEDLSKVSCAPMAPGYFPEEGFGKRRILRVPCFDQTIPLHPMQNRPIEGVLAIVDADTGEVIDVKEAEPVVVPDTAPGYGPDAIPARGPMKPVLNLTPGGSNIELEGALEVSWQDWSFHLRADRRSGLILSLARFRDKGEERLVAYQMAVSEMFVPYMDPDPAWAFRTYLDAGEFGLGYLISSLGVGTDCPHQAYYVTLLFPSDEGGMFKADRALCIFERNTGNPAWRHYDAGSGRLTSRPEVELVVRTIPTIGNYDYIVDWVFTNRGSIKVNVGATGFDAVKTVRSPDMEAETAGDDTEFGALVAPYVVAPYHDHFFSFRLDLDVDGPQNSFVRDLIVPEPAPAGSLRTSLWRLVSEPVGTEGRIVPTRNTHGEVWRLINPNRRTAMLKGHPGYQIEPGTGNTLSSLPDNDPAQKRAQFSSTRLWLTRYKPDELYAAGDYPMGEADRGLPRFIDDRQSIENADIVAWYTLGFHHVTRPEDWPILPTRWLGFTIRPMGFFDRDPSADLAPEFARPPSREDATQ
ncbi:hypothetical protein HW532_00860 [Kaustia mangrovi]|uniref:Amine oxidase n=1 Tax=Kaustia mangrovi TaxID=2593653 RepID=A0A7S8HAG8_9HYPH|nr:hypothetical protein [Kaustia mangrovi]QPC41414.1 hypothetical protein HW532_00860 [Kaustia mangrovi]